MPVDTKNKLAIQRGKAIKKVRDFMGGRETALSYVRELPGHKDDPETADAYRNAASYLNVTEKTLKGFTGAIMNPSPNVSDKPSGFDEFLEDMTNDGEPFERIAHKLVSEVITAGRCGILVDFPKAPEDANRTEAIDIAMGLRSYARLYQAEDILDWRVGMVGGRAMLTHIRLQEVETVIDPKDEFAEKSVDQIRVLDLIEGAYQVRLYRTKPKSTNGLTNKSESASAKYELFDEYFPKKRDGTRLEYIPFITAGPESLDPRIFPKPPLEDLVDLSCDHLQNSASHEWALRWLGSPTLVIAGRPAVDESGKMRPIRIGSPHGIILGEGSTAEILTLGAEGVGGISSAMERKERQMAAIGARMIMIDGGSGQISHETERLRRAGEHSTLAGISQACSDALTQALRIMAEWEGKDDDKIKVECNKDFLPVGLQTGELTEWVGALQTGSIPLQVFVSRLKDRGVLDGEMDEEKFRDLLDEDGFGITATEDPEDE